MKMSEALSLEIALEEVQQMAIDGEQAKAEQEHSQDLQNQTNQLFKPADPQPGDLPQNSALPIQTDSGQDHHFRSGQFTMMLCEQTQQSPVGGAMALGRPLKHL